MSKVMSLSLNNEFRILTPCNIPKEKIQCSGQGEVQFWEYEDTTGCGEDNCDFYFKKVVIKDDDRNVLHSVSETEHKSGDKNHGNKNLIYFSTVDELNKVFEVKISTGKLIKISFEAWDKNSGSDDLESTWTDLEVPFSETGVSSEWSYKSYTKGTNRERKFTFRYRITSCDNYFTGRGCNSCVKYRYGADCRTYCKPLPGFFTCSSRGEMICEQRRKGEDCSDCKEQYKGSNCENCAENYYPKNTCEVHCLPVPNKYICTDQGKIQCLQNRNGSECEYCISNHYGEDCSKFCEETDNYKCDESGGNVCKEHFYPAEKCDINCEPVPGNFTCNQTTGQKICAFGKVGHNCDVCENRNKVGQSCENCKKFYFGPDCIIRCKPDLGFYSCSNNGSKICLDNKATVENNCGAPDQHEEQNNKNKKSNVVLIVGAGGSGGVFIILVITAVILKIRGGKNEYKDEELVDDVNMDDVNEGPVYSTVNKESGRSTLNNTRPNNSRQYEDPPEETTDVTYSRINRKVRNKINMANKEPSPEEEAMYSNIQRKQGTSADDDKDTYSRLDRDGNAANPTQTEDEDTYAEVSFVRNREGEDQVKYRNITLRGHTNDALETEGEDATYLTVTDLV